MELAKYKLRCVDILDNRASYDSELVTLCHNQ